jgi:hypothetical protein
MHEMFRLIQQVTETTPRSTPRVPTHLTTRCRREGREWMAAMLSLSSNGCLIRSPEPMLLGSRMEVGFALPRTGELRVEAEMAYQLLPDVGLIFHGITTTQRQAIERFVMEILTPPHVVAEAAG